MESDKVEWNILMKNYTRKLYVIRSEIMKSNFIENPYIHCIQKEKEEYVKYIVQDIQPII